MPGSSADIPCANRAATTICHSARAYGIQELTRRVWCGGWRGLLELFDAWSCVGAISVRLQLPTLVLAAAP
jgi:hypothetical protein